MSKRIGIALTLTLLVFLFAATVTSSQHEADLPPDLVSWLHINSLVVPDTASPIHGIHHFYANESAVNTMTGGLDGGSYPDGAAFVGVVFAPVKTDEGRFKEGDRVAYTLMRKDSGNEATANTGGWHFVMFSADGSRMDIDPVKNCFECHQPHSKTDFVMSEMIDLGR